MLMIELIQKMDIGFIRSPLQGHRKTSYRFAKENRENNINIKIWLDVLNISDKRTTFTVDNHLLCKT